MLNKIRKYLIHSAAPPTILYEKYIAATRMRFFVHRCCCLLKKLKKKIFFLLWRPFSCICSEKMRESTKHNSTGDAWRFQHTKISKSILNISIDFIYTFHFVIDFDLTRPSLKGKHEEIDFQFDTMASSRVSRIHKTSHSLLWSCLVKGRLNFFNAKIELCFRLWLAHKPTNQPPQTKSSSFRPRMASVMCSMFASYEFDCWAVESKKET